MSRVFKAVSYKYFLSSWWHWLRNHRLELLCLLLSFNLSWRAIREQSSLAKKFKLLLLLVFGEFDLPSLLERGSWSSNLPIFQYMQDVWHRNIFSRIVQVEKASRCLNQVLYPSSYGCWFEHILQKRRLESAGPRVAGADISSHRRIQVGQEDLNETNCENRNILCQITSSILSAPP